MRVKNWLYLVAGAVLGLSATSASAQSLPERDAVDWESVGSVQFVQYWIDPTSILEQDGVTRVLMRASSPPGPSDGINTAVARLAIDCASRRIAVEVLDYYSEVAGYQQSATPGGDLAEPVDPGQILVIGRVCTPQPA